MSEKDLNTTENKNILQDRVLKTIIADIQKISKSFDKISVDLNSKSQKLIKEINTNAAELSAKTSDDQTQILEKLREDLEELNTQLKQLPYSNNLIINNLCKAINTLLEKLADFFMNGPLVSEGVYIANPSQPHHFNFFHLSKPISTSVEDLSKSLNPFSTSP